MPVWFLYIHQVAFILTISVTEQDPSGAYIKIVNTMSCYIIIMPYYPDITMSYPAIVKSYSDISMQCNDDISWYF